MLTLLRFGWRELLRMKGRTLLITLILAVQTIALGDALFTIDSLFYTRDHYYDSLRLADLDVQFVAAPSKELPSVDELRAIPGVRDVSRRFVQLGYIEKKDGAPLPVVVHHLDPSAHPSVNDIQISTGSFLVPGDAEAAIADRSFAESSELKTGDKIVVNPHRFAMPFTIAGTALSPEYLVPTSNPEVLIPNKGSLGVLYANRAQLDKLFLDNLYNDLLFTFDPKADPVATKDRVLLALSALDIERVTPKKSQFGYRYVEEMLGGRRIFFPVVALIIAMMAAIVTAISVNRLVVNRRREIGTLLAHGAAPSQFVVGFTILGLLPGIAGGLLGLLGAMRFAVLMARKNASIAGLPEPLMQYRATSAIAIVLAAVLVGLLSALVPALSVYRLRPAHALRGGDEIRFSGLPRPLERLLAGSISVRYALRNVFRRVRLSFATAVLVALAIGMPSGLLTTISSWETWSKSETATLHYDATASFKVPMKDELVLGIMSTKGVGDYEGYAQGYGTLSRQGAEQEVRVRGIAVPSDFVAFDLRQGRPFSGPDADEVILNDAFSHGLPPPRLDELVTVVHHGRPHTLKVVGIVSSLSISTIFAPIHTTQRIFGNEGKLSGAYLTFGEPKRPRPVLAATLPPEPPRPEHAETIDDAEALVAPPPPGAPARPRGTDPQSMRSVLLDNELVTSVQLKSELEDAMISYFHAFDEIVKTFVLLGGLLAFLFVLSILGFLLLERESEYATLRSMGYGTTDIAKSVLTEVAVLGTLGLALSVGAWMTVSLVLRTLLAYVVLPVPLDFRAVDIATVAVPTIGFMVAAAVPGIRRLMHLQLATVLRSRATG